VSRKRDSLLAKGQIVNPASNGGEFSIAVFLRERGEFRLRFLLDILRSASFLLCLALYAVGDEQARNVLLAVAVGAERRDYDINLQRFAIVADELLQLVALTVGNLRERFDLVDLSCDCVVDAVACVGDFVTDADGCLILFHALSFPFCRICDSMVDGYGEENSFPSFHIQVTSAAIYSVKWGGIVRLLLMARPPLPVDWQAIRGLYLQGIHPREIANQFEINVKTLRARACREGWNVILNRSKLPLKEKSVAIAGDIWSERRETIRERIHLIGDRMTIAASQLSEDQLLNKADKIKIATEIAGKSVGLDKQEDKNVVNIALLGSYADSDTIEGSFQSVPTLHVTE